ncbi:hypothetical protein AVEN_133598-1 [Araneus ventricosus]|uniref:Uncharacterized protein n=1 Tax=Araneus ventricosus TaxID=182803 RepID=A0A4Y2JJ34_ARAVE|nr:hypothetical protein AVEN_133598-1 [Araneus ventricosus]
MFHVSDILEPEKIILVIMTVWLRHPLKELRPPYRSVQGNLIVGHHDSNTETVIGFLIVITGHGSTSPAEVRATIDF